MKPINCNCKDCKDDGKQKPPQFLHIATEASPFITQVDCGIDGMAAVMLSGKFKPLRERREHVIMNRAQMDQAIQTLTAIRDALADTDAQ